MTIEEVESTITHYDTTILERLNKLRELIDNLHGLALLIDDDIYQLNQLCELHNYPIMLPNNYAFGLCSNRFNPQPATPDAPEKPCIETEKRYCAGNGCKNRLLACDHGLCPECSGYAF